MREGQTVSQIENQSGVKKLTQALEAATKILGKLMKALDLIKALDLTKALALQIAPLKAIALIQTLDLQKPPLKAMKLS